MSMNIVNNMKVMRALLLCGFVAGAGVVFAMGPGESGEFEYDGIRQIQVISETFDVDVEATRGRQTSLEIRNQPDNYRILHARSGDQLSIWVEREFSLLNRPHRGQLVLLVPGDADMRIEASTGDVRVRNLKSDRLEVDTSTGEVWIDSVSSSLSVDTSTGGVEINDSAGRFSVTTSTGDIQLRNTSGDITAASSTGSHTYMNVIGDLSARSTTGRIEVDGIQGTLMLRTSTGNQRGRGIALTGNSSFDSSTGSIEMDLRNDVESLEFDLRSTTGSLQVGRERSQRELYLGGTGFTIRGRSSTGSQEYY